MEITNNPAILPGPLRPEDTAEAAGEEARLAAEADFESFLTLLTAQLQNQDPLQPIDSTEFVGQLASFSTVEQLIGTNERLDDFAAQSVAGDIASFAAWIGREVAATNGSFRATGEPRAFAVPSDIAAERVSARVVGQDGATLSQFTVATDGTGTGQWNGLDADGVPVLGQDVSIVLDIPSGEETIERAALVFQEVTGIRGSSAGPVLDLSDGTSLAPDQVSQLRRLQP